MATKDVLSEMASMFSEAKDEKRKAAGLTPVAGESGAVLDRKTKAAFPYDDMETVKTAVLHALKGVADLRQELDHIEGGLITLGSEFGIQSGPQAPRSGLLAEVKQAAAAAPNDTFDEHFAAISAAAQAATFKDATAPGWHCPAHPGTETVGLESRKGRKYRACGEPGCTQFEK